MTVINRAKTEQPLRTDELNSLLEDSFQSLRRIVQRTLGQFPSVRRWDETDDVLQVVYEKFHREVMRRPPRSRAHFFALAARMIRNQIIDLARRNNGPHGIHTNHQTNGHLAIANSVELTRSEKVSMDRWSEFHQLVAELPSDLRLVVDQLWYGEQAMPEVAESLGVSLSTVQRRWRQAQRILAKKAKGIRPE